MRRPTSMLVGKGRENRSVFGGQAEIGSSFMVIVVKVALEKLPNFDYPQLWTDYCYSCAASFKTHPERWGRRFK